MRSNIAEGRQLYIYCTSTVNRRSPHRSTVVRPVRTWTFHRGTRSTTDCVINISRSVLIPISFDPLQKLKVILHLTFHQLVRWDALQKKDGKIISRLVHLVVLLPTMSKRRHSSLSRKKKRKEYREIVVSFCPMPCHAVPYQFACP